MATKAIIELILKDAKFNAALKKSKKEMGRISGQRKFVNSMKKVGVSVENNTKGMKLRSKENGRFINDFQALNKVEAASAAIQSQKKAKQDSIIAGQSAQRKSLRMLSQTTGLTMSEVKSRLGKMNAEWDKSGNLVNSANNKMIISNKRMAKGVKKVSKEMKSASFVAKTGGRAFAGWAMSIMFAGMVIMRTFQMITKATVGTFMKVAEGTSEASRGILRLSAEFEYLKYVVGNAIASAIGPLIPKLVEWMRWIENLAKEHPVLVSSIILGGLAFGFLAMTLGQTILGVNGFIDLMGHLGAGIKWIKGLTWSTVLAYVAWGAAIIVAMAAIYMIARVLGNPKANGMEKFLAILALVTAALIIPALMLALWPEALALALVAMFALIWLLGEKVGMAYHLMALDLDILVNGWVLKWIQGLSEMERMTRVWVNKAIALINTLPVFDFSPISEDPTMLIGDSTRLTMKLLDLERERIALKKEYDDMESPAETAKRVFLGKADDYIAEINAKYGPGKDKVPVEYWGTSSLKYGTVDEKGKVVTAPGQVASAVAAPTTQSTAFTSAGTFDIGAMGKIFSDIEALRPAGAGETAQPINNYNVEKVEIYTKEEHAKDVTYGDGLKEEIDRKK